MRCLIPLLACLILLACAAPIAAAALHPDDLHGFWGLDEAAVTDEQQAAAEQAKAVEGFGILFTLRMARVTFDDDQRVAGMWRLEDADDNSATLVVQPKGGAERRYQITVKGDRMTVAEAPGGLPLVKVR